MEATATPAPRSGKTIEEINAEPHLVSTTGMLHRTGCGAVQPWRSPVRRIGAEAAVKITKRCKHCCPMPMGNVVSQADRKTVTAQMKAQAEAERNARLAEQDAAWAAQQSPELDELLRTFWTAMIAEESGTGSLEDARTAFQAMTAVSPEGWNQARRAKELGLPSRAR